MAGVRDELILDITQAQRQIDALEAQITTAFSNIAVEVDVAGISREITAAVNAADTNTPVTVDTTGVTSEITSAVDRADTDVRVDADTTSARGQVVALRRDLDDTHKSANTLRNVLTGAALVAGVRGLFALAEASSAVNEQITGSEIVFGTLADEVQRFADQADRIGLGEAQALQLSNTFGQLALSAGLAGQQVEEFATTIVARGADIASLRDVDLTRTLDALRSGLVGETEPLRNIGIFINEASVATEAYRLGIASLGDELTDAQKIQARYSLILQQSEIAAGNFALTADGLANKQRQVRAGLEDLAARSGSLLEPTFLSLATVAERRLIPALGDLAERALPPLGQLLEDLAPVLGVSLDLLIALAPALGLVADVVGAIPAPLLAIGGATLIANRALGGLLSLTSGTGTALSLFPKILAGTAQALPTATAGVGGLSTGITGLATSLSTANPIVLLAAGGLAAYFATITQAADEKRRFRVEVQEATDALKTEDGQVRLTTQGLADYVDESSRFRTKDQIDDLGRLGFTFSEVSTLAQQGAEGLRTFLDQALATGEVTEVFAGQGNTLVDATGRVVGELGSLSTEFGKVQEVGGRMIAGNDSVISSFLELQAVTEATARAQVEGAVAAGLASQAQVDAALRTATGRDGVISYAEALGLLQGAFDATEAKTQGIIARYDAVANQFIDTAAAVALLRGEVPEVATVIRGLRGSTDVSEQGLLGMAIAADQAALSEEQMAAAAKLLGVDVDDLAGFIETTTSALDDFVTTAVGKLPSISTAFDTALGSAKDAARQAADAVRQAADDRAEAVLDGATTQIEAAGDALSQAEVRQIQEAAQDRAAAIREGADSDAAAIEDAAQITAAGLAKSLRDQADQLADFRGDLDKIRGAGFADLAGLLAAQGGEAGDALADELSAALDAGNVAILDSLRQANADFERESDATVSFIRDELGPELLSATGLIASAIRDNFGDNLDFEEKVRISAGLAATELDVQGTQIASVAAVEGAAAARAYGEALGLDEETIAAGIAAGEAIANGAPVGAATAAGRATGEAFGDGLIEGLSNRGQAASDKAAQLALQADTAMRRALGIKSPSTVAMEIGEFLAQGLALGIDRGGQAAVAASVRTASQVAAGLASQVPAFGLRPDAQAALTTGAGFAGVDADILAKKIAAEMAGVLPTPLSFDLGGSGAPRDVARAAFARARAIDRRRAL